jgi:hypothetical protein
MPAQAGIQVCSSEVPVQNMDSGLRRNDGNKNRFPIDQSGYW